MKFVCRNKDCKKYGIEDNYASVTYKFMDGKLMAECACCPCCGQLREEINPNNEIPLSEKNVSIGTYTKASPEQRREILKKRSHDHYEREIKPYKEHKLHEMVKNFKDASKG